MTTAQQPGFTMTVAPSAITLSRGYNNRTEAPRTHPRQTIIVSVSPTGGLTYASDVCVVDTSYTGGPGVNAANPQYVQYYGGNMIGGPRWQMTIGFITMPSSVPLGLHRCFVQARVNYMKPWVKVPLNITIVDP